MQADSGSCSGGSGSSRTHRRHRRRRCLTDPDSLRRGSCLQNFRFRLRPDLLCLNHRPSDPDHSSDEEDSCRIRRRFCHRRYLPDSGSIYWGSCPRNSLFRHRRYLSLKLRKRLRCRCRYCLSGLHSADRGSCRIRFRYRHCRCPAGCLREYQGRDPDSPSNRLRHCQHQERCIRRCPVRSSRNR